MVPRRRSRGGLFIGIVMFGCIFVATPRAIASEAEAHYAMAVELKRDGKLEDAIKELNTALALQPDYAPAEFSLGLIYRTQKKLQDSYSHLARAVQLRPDSAEYRTSLGITEYHLGRPDDAVRDFERACELDRDNRPAHESLLTIYTLRRDYEKAAAHRRELVRLDASAKR